MKMINRNSDRAEQYSPFIVIMYEYLVCNLIRVKNGPNYKMRIYLDEKLVFSKIVDLTEGLKIVDSTYYEIQKIKEETNVHRL
jgi:hypothetical protein